MRSTSCHTCDEPKKTTLLPSGGRYTLDAALQEGKLRSAAEKSACLVQLAAALSGLHAVDRVHSDVKPANFMGCRRRTYDRWSGKRGGE